jgi:hypothetical protein
MKIGILPTQEMLAHSDVWLHDPRIRSALAADPIGQVLLEKIGEVHGKLADSQIQRQVAEKRIAAMTEQLGALDSRHVDLARAIYHAITAAAHACTDPDQAGTLRALREALLPDGLNVINASYMGRSGAAVEIRASVTAAMRDHLRSIRLGGRDLAELLDEWLDTAEHIGRLAHERSSLVASISKTGSDAARVDRMSARRAWLQVGRTLLSNLPFMSVPDAIREEIEASLARSVRGARRRQQRAVEPVPEPDTRASHDADAVTVDAAGTAANRSGHGFDGRGADDSLDQRVAVLGARNQPRLAQPPGHLDPVRLAGKHPAKQGQGLVHAAADT